MQNLRGDQEWIILSNLDYAPNPVTASVEIDLIILGFTGIHIIEVKHWNSEYLKNYLQQVNHETDKLQRKVKKIVTNLRNYLDIPYVAGKFLLTKSNYRGLKANKRERYQDIECFGVNEWLELLDLHRPSILSPQEIKQIC